MKRLSWQYLEAIVYELFVFRVESAFQNAVTSIAFVVEKRMPYVVHVYANLVSPSRLEPAFYHCHISEPFNDTIVGDSMFSYLPFREYLETQPVVRVTRYVSGNGPFVFRYIAPYYSHILAFYGMVEKLFCKVKLRKVVLGYHKQT